VSLRRHQSSSFNISSSLKLVGVSSDVWVPVSTNAYYTNCLVTDCSCAAANCSRKHSLTHRAPTLKSRSHRNATQRKTTYGTARCRAFPCVLQAKRAPKYVKSCHDMSRRRRRCATVGCSDEQLHANVVYLSLSPTTVIRATYSIERCCLSDLSLVCI